MNIVILAGRLVKDPETRYTNSKKAVCSFTIAVEDGKDQNGERRSQFISCVAWEKTAELIDQYFTKGEPISVTGKITSRSYEKDGRKVYVTEVRVSSIEFPMTARLKKDDRETEGDPAPVNAFADLSDDEELPF